MTGRRSYSDEPAILRAWALGAAVKLLAVGAALVSLPANAASSRPDFADLTLEELSNIEITSVSRRAERLQDAASSVFVITAENIRRSGVTTLPEALRLAPNLQVARVNASQYAISARGFNNAIGNKLLVLIDGRTVYTPLFSGVFWDQQDVMLEDVERIEVISGPGATLWGANAVNGVINVITRSAGSTQGALVAAGGGNREAEAAVRYGGELGADGRYRVYAKGSYQASTDLSSGVSANDRYDRAQVGFRADWRGANGGFTLQGDAYQGEVESGPLGKPRRTGLNLLARWNRQLADGSSVHVQTYYDHTERDDPLAFRDRMDIFDIEAHHAIAPMGRHKILWGGGYRYARDSTETHFNALNPLPVVFMPASRSLDWGNLFVQDEIQLTDAVDLTLGAKVESNVYTGVEFLPSVRLAWKPADNHLIWGAASRAVRAPARLDRDFFLYLQLPRTPLIPVIRGGPDFESEVSNVYELGYRAQPFAALSFSVTAFHHVHDKLRSGQPPPAFIQNMIDGTTNGVEAWGNFQATRAWRLSAGLVELRQNLRVKPGSLDPTGPSALGNDPKHQWQLRSTLNLSDRHDLDVAVRHVSALPNPVVPAYTAVDVRFGWQLDRKTELSLTVQILFDPKHVEFGAPATASEIERSVYLKLLWRM
jgi:iron complex outermembrane receptor protein